MMRRRWPVIQYVAIKIQIGNINHGVNALEISISDPFEYNNI